MSGWLEYNRGNKFITLRDFTGSCQVFINNEVNLPKIESVITVKGTVHKRPDGNKNPAMETGEIEVVTSNVEVLNECERYHFPLNDYSKAKEDVRMRYRYFDIRSKMMQHNLRLRSSFLMKVRRFLCEEQGFVDVETPTLFRRTPGGAKEFIVPTANKGKFFSLPQSPQQFKQLLMVGGIDRYMQIARCYRDENTKPERQPEFTQLDLELSFTTQGEIKQIIERMLKASWPKHLPDLMMPFPRMSYTNAMLLYGSDKPDTRFDCTIKDITEELSHLSVFDQTTSPVVVKGICIPNGSNVMSSKNVKRIQRAVEAITQLNIATVTVKEDCSWKSPLTKYMGGNDLVYKVNCAFQCKPGDLLFICGHIDWELACKALGRCRILSAKDFSAAGKPLYQPGVFNPLWVEEFPLFELDEGSLVSAHHPFTAPVDEDFDMLQSDPLKVRGQHYDLVLNGSEIGGGSIRIHSADTQKYVLESILKEDSSKMKHLLEALESGCPPHGGIALGLDRLLAIMCGSDTIRDVIAFPKSSDGADLMCEAPCHVTDDELDRYHISITKDSSSH